MSNGLVLFLASVAFIGATIGIAGVIDSWRR